MKLSFHQHIALFWMIGAPGVFAPVIERQAARCRRRHGVGCRDRGGDDPLHPFAAALSTIPALVWPDGCAVGQQRQALAERGLRRYYQTAFDDGYVPA